MNTEKVISCNPEKAQEDCNFIIFIPHKIPSDIILTGNDLRKEVSETARPRCSYRQVFSGSNRRLIIKQFLYDWAPPAYDYPSLWRNKKIASMQESPPPKAVFVKNHALWIGMNYRKQNGATIEIERTRIEMTFEQGTFSENEIVSFCESFNPVNLEKRRDILSTPFSQWAYSARHIEKVVSVPTGYWEHLRNASLLCFSLYIQDIQTVIPGDFSNIIQTLKDQKYLLNSAFGYGIEKSKLEEIELIFEHQSSPGSIIRVLYTSKDGVYSIQFPPKLSDQECDSEVLTTNNGQSIYYAHSKQFAFGSHELVLSIGQYNIIVLVKPAPWTSHSWLRQLVEQF